MREINAVFIIVIFPKLRTWMLFLRVSYMMMNGSRLIIILGEDGTGKGENKGRPSPALRVLNKTFGESNQPHDVGDFLHYYAFRCKGEEGRRIAQRRQSVEGEKVESIAT